MLGRRGNSGPRLYNLVQHLQCCNFPGENHFVMSIYSADSFSPVFSLWQINKYAGMLTHKQTHTICLAMHLLDLIAR